MNWSKTIPISGSQLSNGALDAAGNIYLGTGWGGYNLYKYDPTLANQQWDYYNSATSFEYVEGTIVDASGNVYGAGSFFSGSNAGGTLVKLNSSGGLLWSVTDKNTSYKDDYAHAMAVASNGFMYRAGDDNDENNTTKSVGRILGYNASNGNEVLNIALTGSTTPASKVYGLVTDSSNNLLDAYTYNTDYFSGGSTLPQTVIEKRNQSGTVLWTCSFNVPGMYLGCNGGMRTLLRRTDDCYYLGFTQISGGTTVPGIAKISGSGQLLGMDTINMPGWQVSGSIDASASMVYLPLTKPGSTPQTAAVAVTPTVLWNGGGADSNWSTYANWSGWAPAHGRNTCFRRHGQRRQQQRFHARHRL